MKTVTIKEPAQPPAIPKRPAADRQSPGVCYPVTGDDMAKMGKGELPGKVMP